MMSESADKTQRVAHAQIGVPENACIFGVLLARANGHHKKIWGVLEKRKLFGESVSAYSNGLTASTTADQYFS